LTTPFCRKHWLLVSDAWLFALLNIAEFIHRLHQDLIPSLVAFEVYDRVLAAASAVPLLLFMLFLLSYAKAELLPILPIRYRSTLALILLLCIPIVLITTELAALLGFSYSKLSLALIEQRLDSPGRKLLS
jgi:ABC-type protease/lipase transport system fused ATPase/permease subunit